MKTQFPSIQFDVQTQSFSSPESLDLLVLNHSLFWKAQVRVSYSDSYMT